MIDQAKRDEWRRLLAAADPAPWRFELGDAESSDGHIVTSAPADKPWSESPILCSHIFGPRDAANYALMAAAPTAIHELLAEVQCLEQRTRPFDSAKRSDLRRLVAEMQRWHDENLAHEQECVRCDNSVHTPSGLDPTPLCNACAQDVADESPALLAEVDRLEAMHLEQCKRIDTLASERIVDAHAFASPASRIANLEHELADLRESETTQATRIESLEFRLKVADAEVASLRLRVEAWATIATGISR